jgi:hypothetical protein
MYSREAFSLGTEVSFEVAVTPLVSLNTLSLLFSLMIWRISAL